MATHKTQLVATHDATAARSLSKNVLLETGLP